MSEDATLSAAPIDPLAGDWSAGLPGPVRALDVPQPQRLAVAPAAAGPDVVEVPIAWEDADSDPLQSAPPPPPAPEVTPAFAVPAPAPAPEPPPPPPELPPPAPALPPLPDVAPTVTATFAAPVIPEPPPAPPSDDAPTPWSEPVAATPAVTQVWEVPLPAEPPEVTEPAWLPPAPAAAAPAPSVDEAWSAPPAAAEPVAEWQPEAPASDFEAVQKPEPAVLAQAPAADWSTLNSGPDWSAPADAAPVTEEAWSAAPPPFSDSEWAQVPAQPSAAIEWSPPAPAPAAEPDWSAPPAAAAAVQTAEADWSAPAAVAAAPAPAWNSPAVGASALEQLDSEPPEPQPGAARELFGSVGLGQSLSGDDENLGPPEELQSPEDVLKPVDPHDDPDLLVPVDEAAPPRPRATLAVLRPANAGALEVFGEHRVAVHTRGGRTLRGTIRDIDLAKPQFPLQPQGGGNTETIYHSDVKVIFFMLAPGEKPKAGDGAKVRVTLSDGRVIDGNRDSPDAKHGFFLVPGDAARTNTRRIYVAREATNEIKDG